MENAEEVMQILERFTRLKQKEIPKELDDYLQFVAKTGDTVFKWANLKYLFREKLLNVITHFYDTTPRMDEIPQYPNVDPFNYESMKSSLLERLELFNAAPFTIQRLCELLIDPKKQYNRIDKFMRALEKNILVVSTVEPGRKRTESENGDSLDSVVNGDISLDVNVDIDMENESLFSMEATQNGNGTAAVVSPVGATESINDSESVSDTKQEDESDAVVKVTSTHEPPTGDDEDLQPSSKKAKLDTDVETVEATTKPAEKVAEGLENVETADQIVAKEVVEEKKNQEVGSVNSEIKAETNGVSEAVKQTTANSESIDETKKQLETEAKAEETTVVATKIVPEEENNETVESSSNETKDIVTSATITDNDKAKENTEVDSSKKAEKANLDEISSAVEESEQQEAAEKIIEKQELEKCEKEIILAKADTKSSSEDNTPTQSENGKSLEPKADDIATSVKDAPKEEKVSTEQSVNEAEVVTEISAKSKGDTTAADLIAEPSSKGETDADKLITSSTSITVEEAKTEGIENCVTTTEDVKKVEATPKTAETAATTITSTSNSETTVAKETETPSEAATVVAPITEELPAAKTDAVETSTAESITAVTSAGAAVVAITPPTLSLNDQPMDEDAITNVVDEIVMAESISTTTGDGIEMATDAMEATASSDVAKIDEPTDGMDVDDTSPQEEAMDQ